MKTWIGIFSRSPKSRLAWQTKTGLKPPSYSPTRWWSKWEVMKHIHDLFGDVKDFFDGEELPPSKAKFQDILSDDPANRKLQMELAITIDAGESFVKSTYVLEGDGALAFRAFEEVSKLLAVISTAYYPNVIAVAKKLSGDIPTREKTTD